MFPKNRLLVLLVGSLLLGLFILLMILNNALVVRHVSQSLVSYMTSQHQAQVLSRETNDMAASVGHQECPATSQLRDQRNTLSRMLNEMKQQFGQLECNMGKISYSQKSQVSSSGGWCEDESNPKKTNTHKFDKQLAEALSQFLSGQRVASFGDGPGQYKEYLLTQGLVASYDAYDGAPFCEKVTDGAVKFLDLTLPQYGLPVYDWVMCLEVAEHVPARYELVLVDNLARHARKGIVLSWGHPGQDGFHHVNNKSPEDVKRLLDEAGFILNDSDSLSLRQNSTFSWFKENTFVFKRKSDFILVKDNE